MLKSLIDRFTTTPLVGVDIGSAALKVVEISQEEDKVILRRCGVAGAEGEDTAELLKKLLEVSGVTTTNVAIAVSSSEVIAKPFEYPPMPGKEFLKAIRLEAEQETTHGKSDMAVDWHAFPSNGGEATRGLLAVVPKSTLTRHLEIVRKAGLRPVIADVAGLALWNAYWTLLGRSETAPKTVLLMNIGAKTTNLIIAKGPDTLILARDFNLGAKALTEGHETEWSAEVRDSLGYARSRAGMRALDDVYVTGGGSDRNLKLLLSQMAGVPIVFWNPLEHITRSPGLSVDEAAGPLFAVAIGLALRRPT